MKTKTVAPPALTPPASLSLTHRVTHVTGRRVTCSCGWATAGNIADQATGQLIAESHITALATERQARGLGPAV